MDIRRLVDIHNPEAIEYQLIQEKAFQNLVSYGGSMDKAQRRQFSESRKRCKALEQAYTDTIYASDWRDSQYGEDR